MKKKQVILLIILIVILGGAITITAVYKNLNKSLERLASTTIPDVDLTTLEDGTYTGSYQSFPVMAEVEVTINSHKITGIKLVKHINGQGKPAEVITDKVLEAQSLNVDSISGATYSSKVILMAIGNALNVKVK